MTILQSDFYTGFPNLHTVSSVYNYLNPGVEGENITYWLSQSNLAVPADFYEDEEKEEPSRKHGRSRSLRPIDEFFVALCRLRQGLPEEHLAHLFQVSVSTIRAGFYHMDKFHVPKARSNKYLAL